MKQQIIFIAIIVLAFSSQLVRAESITDTYASGDTLTATKMDTIKSAVNDNDSKISANTTSIGANIIGIAGNAINISDKQDRVNGVCPVGQSIRVINADGTVTCEVDTVTISGVRGVNSSSSVNISTTTHTEIATVIITESGTFDVALNAHASIEISGASERRFQLEIRNTSCSGTLLGQAMWRPGGSASDSSLYANTISLTGFQASVIGPETYVLCARKFDSLFPDALIFYRGLNLIYSN